MWSLSTASMIRSMVRTAAIGCAPTEVSPDSITASAPSSTALATSEASARVGREFAIIDSSIWVATMTGLLRSRAAWIARFCTSGTCSSGSSTPRSPRATMMPSKASTISSSRSTASGFSSLAMTGTSMSSCRMISRTSSASSAERTKDSAMKSTPSRSAKRRSSSSLSDSAGHAHGDAGQRQALVVRHRAALDHQADDVGALDRQHGQGELAVVHQQPVAHAGRRWRGPCRSSRPARRCPRRPRR